MNKNKPSILGWFKWLKKSLPSYEYVVFLALEDEYAKKHKDVKFMNLVLVATVEYTVYAVLALVTLSLLSIGTKVEPLIIFVLIPLFVFSHLSFTVYKISVSLE